MSYSLQDEGRWQRNDQNVTTFAALFLFVLFPGSWAVFFRPKADASVLRAAMGRDSLGAATALLSPSRASALCPLRYTSSLTFSCSRLRPIPFSVTGHRAASCPGR